jgi:rhodanese-related sulfurtransferase
MATSSETPTVSLREAAELLAGDALFLDVREQGEWDLGHVPEALHNPLGVLEDRVSDELPDREREVVVYCAHGRRSLAALATLRALGYERSRHLSDGFEEGEGRLPVVVPSTLEPDQRCRLQPSSADPRIR